MRILSVIPARGGSKSLPKKNILPLNGKPLLCYSVDYSLQSELINKTIVSTDSEEIAEIARKCGAEVPFVRPVKFAQDNTRDYPVLRHALDFFENQNTIYDIYVLLRPTSPLRPAGLIKQAISILKNNKDATSVRSVAKIKEHPYRTWKLKSDGSMAGFIDHTSEPYNIPRQELPELYFQTGDIEVIRRETLLNGSISGEKVYPLTINHDDMVDIDHIVDFKKAEMRLIK